MLADLALKKILDLPDVKTILDVGCGLGEHSLAFAASGKIVHAVDINYPIAFTDTTKIMFHKRKFLDMSNITPHVDCVWMSHVLEHQPNINIFLIKAVSYLWKDGYLAITVPVAKNEIVGGHLSIWNAGLMLYNLILAGISCKNAMIKKYDYNISVIVKYHPIILPPLKYDYGDIELLKDFFPRGYNFQGFNGDIEEHNWDTSDNFGACILN